MPSSPENADGYYPLPPEDPKREAYPPPPPDPGTPSGYRVGAPEAPHRVYTPANGCQIIHKDPTAGKKRYEYVTQRLVERFVELYESGCTHEEVRASFGARDPEVWESLEEIAHIAGYAGLEEMRAYCLGAGRAHVRLRMTHVIDSSNSIGEVMRISEGLYGGPGNPATTTLETSTITPELLKEAMQYLQKMEEE